MNNKILKFINFLFLCSFFCSCGLFEDDVLLFQRSIIGKLNVQQQNHEKWAELTFVDSPESAISIVGRCKMISYDTIHNRLFVEEYINQWNSSYHQISVSNPNADKSFQAFKRYKLEKERFYFLLANCKTCKEIDLLPAGNSN